MEKRNHYTAEFKAKMVLELLGEKSTLNQVAAKYQLNPQMLSQWKSDCRCLQAERGTKPKTYWPLIGSKRTVPY
jgi:transposase-like protein